MLMRGDMQKLIDHINPVFENCFEQIKALEKRVDTLEKELKEAKKPAPAPKKRPGRPKKAA